MVLSVIIVHYRVPYFLELCLLSVDAALQGMDAEVIVIDNHSGDRSPDFLRPRFPRVKWIANSENAGFSRANNQGLALATGDHILFLNPDTVIPEDFARNCLAFYSQAAGAAGGLGVRMIDGNGRFLKESRRGFPTPWVAFCRLSGLTALFPRSRWFSEYYLGYLPADRNHRAPVLSGACFWVSRKALDAAGPFDENFFMYAEDIDLSYRLEKAGFCNYYIADTTIIHFKGASTQKDLRYIRQFYGAMIQFRRKHFHGGRRGLLRAGFEAAITVRAAVSAAGQFFRGRRGFDGGGADGGRAEGGGADGGGAEGGGADGTAGLGGVAGSGLAGSGGQAGGSAKRRVWLTGDAASAGRLRASLTLSRIVVTDARQADETIFCQGAAFSFRDLISEWGKRKQGGEAGIYADGASAVVSSRRHDSCAEILKL
ncbi:MAG TPA: glycosyltransferase family 2 protein [Puia sp.]|nr:glycosyltransferase family 2 protein [Puia sp.]